ncbi:MAG TPA: MFS transporter [Gaiellales bacterium]|jgi:MFS family permease
MSSGPSYSALFRSPYRALMVAALGATFLGSLDALMVVTALPSAAQDIGGVDLISLAVGATMVTICMTLPVAGALIDRYGVARSFAIACVLFAGANIVGGLAPTMPIVAVARGVLGLGAGFMFAVPLGLFALYVPKELRPRAFGLNAAMWGVSALVGPALGAALTGSVGWRWVFWVNLPLIAIVAWAARLALRSHAARDRQHHGESLNVVGPVLLGATVFALLVAARDPIFAAIAIVPAVGFLVHERRTAVPVFTHRPVSLAANVTSLAAGAAFLGAEVYLPLQLQVGFGEPIGIVAIALVLTTLGWTAGSMAAARFDAAPSGQILLGSVLVFFGTLAMALPAGGVALPIVAYAISGLGMGIASPALFAVVLADGEAGREGKATSSIPLARQVGAGLGTAVAGIVFVASLSDRAVKAAEKSGSHVPAVVPAARHTFVAAALLGAIGLVACYWLRREPRPAVAARPERADRAAA